MRSAVFRHRHWLQPMGRTTKPRTTKKKLYKWKQLKRNVYDPGSSIFCILKLLIQQLSILSYIKYFFLYFFLAIFPQIESSTTQHVEYFLQILKLSFFLQFTRLLDKMEHIPYFYMKNYLSIFTWISDERICSVKKKLVVHFTPHFLSLLMIS